MKRNGFTLIEVMISAAILTVVGMLLYSLNLSMTQGTLQQEALATLRDESRMTLQYLGRRLRMAEGDTLVTLDGSGNEVPFDAAANALGFQVVSDADGNGVAVNQDFSVGLGPQQFYGPDFDDANGDGRAARQLVETDANGNVTEILTPYLDPNGGITFQPVAGGIAINLQLLYPAEGIRPAATLRLTQVISPRN